MTGDARLRSSAWVPLRGSIAIPGDKSMRTGRGSWALWRKAERASTGCLRAATCSTPRPRSLASEQA